MATNTTPKIRYQGVSGMSESALDHFECITKEFLDRSAGPLEPDSEWLVCTKAARDELTTKAILETLYMISDDYLVKYMVDGITLEHVYQIKTLGIESANAILKGLLGRAVALFVQNTIRSLGYGYFLASYDGKEILLTLDWGGVYAYRQAIRKES